MLKFRIIVHLLEIRDGKLKAVAPQRINDIGLINNHSYSKEVKNVFELIFKGIELTYFCKRFVDNKLLEIFGGDFG